MQSEKTCPSCGGSNPAANRYCGQCGNGLRFHALEEKRPAIIDETGRFLPDLDTRQIARSLAISAAALTAELAIVYLRRRLREEHIRDKVVQQAPDPGAEPSRFRRLGGAGAGLLTGAVILVAERQLTEIQDGRPVRQLIERTFYRRDKSQ